MALSPGDRVVCVDDAPFRGRVFTVRRGALVRGETYTVRDRVPQHDWVGPWIVDESCVRLVEIERRYDRIGFRESRFRPVVEGNGKRSARRRRRVAA